MPGDHRQTMENLNMRFSTGAFISRRGPASAQPFHILRLKVYLCHQFESETWVLRWTSEEWQRTYFPRSVRSECSAYPQKRLNIRETKSNHQAESSSFMKAWTLKFRSLIRGSEKVEVTVQFFTIPTQNARSLTSRPHPRLSERPIWRKANGKVQITSINARPESWVANREGMEGGTMKEDANLSKGWTTGRV